ncbi:UNVERIFIED_CONTAM: protein phosphatase 2C domain-containing protein [Hammondia hammondi]|eukprot:XP_008885487.1 protein phosphatase 2C domain-containing protein [Hammondia hammondi]
MGELTQAKFLVETQQEQEERSAQPKDSVESEKLLEHILSRARNSRAQRLGVAASFSSVEEASFPSFSSSGDGAGDIQRARLASSSSRSPSREGSLSPRVDDSALASLPTFSPSASDELFSQAPVWGTGGERTGKKAANAVDRGFALSFGASATVGRRQAMEDATQTVPCFLDGTSAYFAMFDGHNGSELAHFARSQLHSMLAQTLAASSQDVSALSKAAIERSLTDVFHQIDRAYERRNKGAADGATALVLFVRWVEDRSGLNRRRPPRETQAGGDKDGVRRNRVQIFLAHAGDTRAVLGKVVPRWSEASGTEREAEEARGRRTKVKADRLTEDHKPSRNDERVRIERHGGTVVDLGCPRVMVGSVNMALAVSRCLGDFALKRFSEHIVLSTPDVSSRELVPGRDAFVVIASDGLWDVLTDEEAAKLVQRRIDSFFHSSAKRGERGERGEELSPANARETGAEKTDRGDGLDGWFDPGEEARQSPDEGDSWWERGRQRKSKAQRDGEREARRTEPSEQDVETEDAEAFEDYVPKAVLEAAANDLIRVALARMSQDNISVLIVHFGWKRRTSQK